MIFDIEVNNKNYQSQKGRKYSPGFKQKWHQGSDAVLHGGFDPDRRL